MEKKKIEVEVDKKIRDLVESYDYEYTTRRDAVTFMLANNMDTTTDAFKAYQKEMIEYNVKFSSAKQEIEKTYVFPVSNGAKVNWSLDYDTSMLTIEFVS